MINRLLKNNNYAKLLSVLLSLLIWGVAFSEEQPFTANQSFVNESKVFLDIPIHLVGIKDDLSYLLSSETVESLSLSGPAAWIDAVAGVGAYVDLSQIDEEGEYIVEVYIEKLDRLRVTTCYPERVTVFVEAVIEHEFDVFAEYTGSLAPGFYLQNYPEIIPDRVTVRGLRSDIEAIFSVTVIIDLDDSTHSLTKEASLLLKGYAGEMLVLNNYELDPSTVLMIQEVTTSIDLEVIIGEIQLPPQITLLGVWTSPDHLPVYVVVEEVAQIDDLVLESLDIGGADLQQLWRWGIREDHLLYQVLQESEEIQPPSGTRFSQEMTVELILPPGVRWANSMPGTPVIITVTLDLEVSADETQLNMEDLAESDGEDSSEETNQPIGSEDGVEDQEEDSTSEEPDGGA
ncbi:MAG: CdaR family protein [Symbiobacteriaceae bacterium]|nr:CdaR family protein [Symbiobacteriaceae bacterium]